MGQTQLLEPDRSNRTVELIVRLTLEAALIGGVEDEENAHRSSVVRSGDCAESLLPGCIPLRNARIQSV